MKLDSLLTASSNSSIGKVLLPTQKPSLPKYSVGSSRLRPVWRNLPSRWWPLIADSSIFWQLFGTYEGEPILFEPWQNAWLRDHNRYRATEKAPQIGWSWLCALEALHESIVFLDSTVAFVSVDQREATEKILYARKAYEELPQVIRDLVEMPKASTEEIWLGEQHRPSRLLSLPNSSALRGRRMNVYLDEIDLYRDGGVDAFRAAMGRVTRGGRVSMGSTCFGQGTKLDNVCSRNTQEEDNAKVFGVSRLPATVVTNPDMQLAIANAIEELDEGEALEEYFCVRGGLTSDSFPADLLRAQTHELPGFLGSTEELTHMWEPAGQATMGYDVGTSGHPSVAVVWEQQADGVWLETVLHQPMHSDTGKGLSLPEQHEMLRTMLQRIPALRVVLDGNGIGRHTMEALMAEFGEDRVVYMHPGSKPAGAPSQEREQLATEMKRALEANEAKLVQEAEQYKQFHRTKILKGNVVQPGSKRKTHYDRFWAACYGWYGTQVRGTIASVYELRDLVVL